MADPSPNLVTLAGFTVPLAWLKFQLFELIFALYAVVMTIV